MKADSVDLARVADALEALRREVARLGDRVATLERVAGVRPAGETPAPQAAPSPPPAAPAEELSEELVVVIGAAVAAFLGKKPRIRQIRLLGSAGWAQQGRVTIQASHAVPVPHG
jgi:methylmalonyl-CoA carboxyltransferase large subunit